MLCLILGLCQLLLDGLLRRQLSLGPGLTNLLIGLIQLGLTRASKPGSAFRWAPTSTTGP